MGGTGRSVRFWHQHLLRDQPSPDETPQPAQAQHKAVSMVAPPGNSGNLQEQLGFVRHWAGQPQIRGEKRANMRVAKHRSGFCLFIPVWRGGLCPSRSVGQRGCRGRGGDRGTHRPPDHLSPGEEIAFDGAALRLPHGLQGQRGHGLRAAPSTHPELPSGGTQGFPEGHLLLENPGGPGMRPEPQAEPSTPMECSV